MALVVWIPAAFPADLPAGDLATHDIFKTGVDAETLTQAALTPGLPY